jgi:hypothetical protein
MIHRSAFYFVQQFIPHNRKPIRCLGTDADFVTFDCEHGDLNLFAVWVLMMSVSPGRRLRMSMLASLPERGMV